MRIDQIELSGSLFVTSSASIILGQTKISSDNNGSISFTKVNNPTQKVIGSYSGSFTGSIKLPTVPQGAAETNILLVNGSGNVVYRNNLSLTGAQGNQGNQGPTGLQGTTGAQGNQGPTGIQGTVGTNGNQGNQGPQGNQGIQGIQGTVGTQGFQGRQGPQGNQGPTGVQGTAGIVSGVTKIQFGTATPVSFEGTVTFPTAFSSNPIIVTTAQNQGTSPYNMVISITSFSTTSFSYYIINSLRPFNWIAIN